MTKLPECKAMQEAFCVHHVLRSLGFAPDDIFITLAPAAHRSGAMHCFCELRAQGKTFMIDCGHVSEAPNEFLDLARQTGEAIRSGKIGDAELNEAWLKSVVRPQVGLLAAALLRAGFELTCTKMAN